MTELPAAGWLPAKLNRGHRYRDRVGARGLLDPRAEVAPSDGIAAFYAARYVHSALAVWLERLAAGEIWCNGQQLWADGLAQAGDQLVWHRPPWQEAAVPVLPAPLFDDGDLVVINKPRGLPVVPAGGFLEHTLLTQLQQRHQADPPRTPQASASPGPLHLGPAGVCAPVLESGLDERPVAGEHGRCSASHRRPGRA